MPGFASIASDNFSEEDFREGQADAQKQIAIYRETAESLGLEVDSYIVNNINASIAVIKKDVPIDHRARSSEYYQGFLSILQEVN